MKSVDAKALHILLLAALARLSMIALPPADLLRREPFALSGAYA